MGCRRNIHPRQRLILLAECGKSKDERLVKTSDSLLDREEMEDWLAALSSFSYPVHSFLQETYSFHSLQHYWRLRSSPWNSLPTSLVKKAEHVGTKRLTGGLSQKPDAVIFPPQLLPRVASLLERKVGEHIRSEFMAGLRSRDITRIKSYSRGCFWSKSTASFAIPLDIKKSVRMPGLIAIMCIYQEDW